MHAYESEIESLAVTQNARSHKGVTSRYLSLVDKLEKLLFRSADTYSATEQNGRSLSLVDKLHGLFDSLGVGCFGRSRFYLRHSGKLRHSGGDILRNIHENGARSATHCNAEGFSQSLVQFVHVSDNETVLGDRHNYACNIYFLERI